MKKLIIVISLVIAVAFLVIRIDRDESEIRKNLAAIETLLTKSSDEKPLAGFGRARKVGTFFTDDCYVAFGAPVPDIHDDGELLAVVQRVRHAVHRVEVRFDDISISVSDDRDSAEVILTATAIVYKQGNLKGEIEAREVESTAVKVDGSWKFRKVIGIETLH